MCALKIQYLSSAYPFQGRTAALLPSATEQLRIYSVAATNRSTVIQDIAICLLFSQSRWLLGQIVDASTPDLQTNFTTTIQAGTAVNIFDTTNNDGHLIQSDRKFNVVGYSISTGRTGGTYEYTYWDGSAWTALPDVILTPTFSTTSGTGGTLLMFSSPFDWALGTDTTVGGDSTKYSIRVRATTAPGAGSVQANDMWIAKWIEFFPQVPNNGKCAVNMDTTPETRMILDSLEGIIPVFSTAHAKNLIHAQYASLK